MIFKLLLVFKELEKDRVIQNFYRLLRKEDLDSYATFVSSLYEQNTDNWTQYLVSKVLSLENRLVSMACLKKNIPHFIQEASSFELNILEEMSRIEPEAFKMKGFKASWSIESVDLKTMYFDRLKHIDQFGFGEYARFMTFRLEEIEEKPGFFLKPVTHPDPITFKDLIGYDLTAPTSYHKY